MNWHTTIYPNSFEHKISKIISYVFHPLLMPTYGLILLLYTNNYISTFTPSKIKLFIIGITFIFSFIMPALNALILLRMKRINSLEMETPRERVIPYSSAIVYFLALFYLFLKSPFPPIICLLILGAAVSIFLTLIINFKWKISAHAVGVGGIIGAILGISYRLMIDLQLILFISIALAGLVGYARLRLNAHNPTQVYCGFLLGIVTELLIMILY